MFLLQLIMILVLSTTAKKSAFMLWSNQMFKHAKKSFIILFHTYPHNMKNEKQQQSDFIFSLVRLE